MLRSWYRLPFLLTVTLSVLMGLLLVSPARANCSRCKSSCKQGVKKCKRAAPKRLCRIPGFKGVCKMYKNVQCKAAGSICVDTRCNTGPRNRPKKKRKKRRGGGRGEPHLYTFDGVRYDLQTIGEYVLARSAKAQVEAHARFVRYNDHTSSIGVVALRVHGHRIVFAQDREGVVLDEAEVNPSETGLFVSQDVFVQRVGRRILVAAGPHQIWVQVAQRHIDVTLVPDVSADGTWEGLLGNANGDPTDDLRRRDGTTLDIAELNTHALAQRFASDWRIGPETSLLPYAPGETTANYTDDTFPAKHATIGGLSDETYARAHRTCIEAGVWWGEALRSCIYDVGVTGVTSFTDSYRDAPLDEADIVVPTEGDLSLRTAGTVTEGDRWPIFWVGAKGAATAKVLAGQQTVAEASSTGSPIYLEAPKAGTYRVVLEQAGRSVQASVEVKKATATLEGPDRVSGGSAFTIRWSGPHGGDDVLAFVAAGQTDPTSRLATGWLRSDRNARFVAPTTAGSYEVWYLRQGATEPLARKAIAVTAVEAKLTLPSTVKAGEVFAAQWRGPTAEGDYLEVADEGTQRASGPRHAADRAYEGGIRLQAPSQPGRYVVRYVSAAGATLATTALVVSDVSPSLAAPATVGASAAFTVTWTGLARAGDVVAITRRGESNPLRRLSYRSTSTQARIELKAPPKAGAYDVIYIIHGGGGRRIVARRALDVR